MIEHIRKRRNIDTIFWSVSKILEINDMGTWISTCCERIASAEKIDGEHVQIDWTEPGNIVLDWKGFCKTSKILEGYIGEDKWNELFDFFYEKQKAIDKDNEILQMLRELDKKRLKNLIKEADSKLDKESDKMVFKWLKEEIRARRITNRIFQKAKENLSLLYVKLKYYRIFKFLDSYVEEKNKEMEV